MPIYQYICTKCQNEVEMLQSRHDEPPLCFCDEGSPEPMLKQIGLTNFRLKGTGWYKTDYKDKK